MKSYEKSRQLHERSLHVLAGGVASEFRKFTQPHPLFYSHGAGTRIWDVDGNEFLDFTLSQGPLILGHSNQVVLNAVEKASRQGQLFAGQHLDELHLAEKLQELIPCAELLRFSLSGSEADHTALRVARAATGRQRFLRFEGHYHGWFDNVAVGISGTTENLGPREAPTPVSWTAGLPERVQEESIVLPWNDLALVEKVVSQRWQEIAAIITEPFMCNTGCIPPEPGFLQGLRDLCDRYGIVLIFDEVITGFRVGASGAQGYFGITPDLGVFGKAMASGYPISVICGKRRFGKESKPLMDLVQDGVVIHAGTMNSGNPSVAAALATVGELTQGGSYEKLYELGTRLRDGIAKIGREAGTNMLVQGPGPMFHVGFTDLKQVRDYRESLSYDKARYGRFAAAMQERGVRLIGRGLWYVSTAHTSQDIDDCLSRVREAIKE
jgi:glutamate-1-semialdehyde 2,1-aminomutase